VVVADKVVFVEVEMVVVDADKVVVFAVEDKVVPGNGAKNLIARKPSSFFFLNTRAIPASEPDQVVSLYEWISFPRRSVDQAIFQLNL
ncbi:hypothetical protein PIB30_112482, partial [Stylosanthes scabra]|nr:hypothetical protein [Stylosanthes scabra]